MNLRKAGKLKIESTRSNRTSVAEVTHIAEIAARSMHDRHAISSDQVMANPKRRNEFDEIAKSFDPGIDLYLVRKAAFQLRKTRKLRPELITRIADWGRVVDTYSVDQISAKPELVPARPGVYIFRQIRLSVHRPNRRFAGAVKSSFRRVTQSVACQIPR